MHEMGILYAMCARNPVEIVLHAPGEIVLGENFSASWLDAVVAVGQQTTSSTATISQPVVVQ